MNRNIIRRLFIILTSLLYLVNLNSEVIAFDGDAGAFFPYEYCALVEIKSVCQLSEKSDQTKTGLCFRVIKPLRGALAPASVQRVFFDQKNYKSWEPGQRLVLAFNYWDPRMFPAMVVRKGGEKYFKIEKPYVVASAESIGETELAKFSNDLKKSPYLRKYAVVCTVRRLRNGRHFNEIALDSDEIKVIESNRILPERATLLVACQNIPENLIAALRKGRRKVVIEFRCALSTNRDSEFFLESAVFSIKACEDSQALAKYRSLLHEKYKYVHREKKAFVDYLTRRWTPRRIDLFCVKDNQFNQALQRFTGWGWSVQETFCKSGQKGETSVNLSIARKKDNRWSYKMIAQNTSKGISWKYCQRAVWSA